MRYGWLHADTRPYPFFTRGITYIITPRRNYFPREIITSRGDNLHYSPRSQAITVLLYRTFYNKRQNHRTRADLNPLARCQLDSLPFVARPCFISVVTVATLLLSVCWHVRICVCFLAQRNSIELLHCVRTDVHCCALLCRGIREIIDLQLFTCLCCYSPLSDR